MIRMEIKSIWTQGPQVNLILSMWAFMKRLFGEATSCNTACQFCLVDFAELAMVSFPHIYQETFIKTFVTNFQVLQGPTLTTRIMEIRSAKTKYVTAFIKCIK